MIYLSVKLSPVMDVFKGTWKRIGSRLESYVRVAGDNPDTVLQKKIWWLLNLFSTPILLLAVVFMGDTLGRGVYIVNTLFLLSLCVPLVIFHYHRQNIEAYALFSQLTIVSLTVVKVYQMGGMLNVGTPVYVGLIGPIYALILPEKRRAIFLFLFYTMAMIAVTLLNPAGGETHIFYRYFMGFLISNTTIFLTLYYFTTQWERAKQLERERLLEMDELKTKFYTHIAHEFRTPLTLISAMVDRMKADPYRWLSRGHDLVRRNSEKLTNLTNQLLDLSKLEAKSMPLKLIHDDVVLYVRYLVASFQSLAASRDITLNFSSTPDEVFMDLDPDKFQDILSNLVSNALKFTPEGGTVSVRLSVLSRPDRNMLQLEVRDTGVGIPWNEQHHIFNRYFQAKNHLDNVTAGSGLGLALTRELVTLMEGEISVESTPGKGAVFQVWIPIRAEADPVSLAFTEISSPEPAFNVSESAGSSKQNINNPSTLQLLVVDDNKDIINYLKTLLEEDYEVQTAGNGADGLRMALETTPDLIISDVMMPVMDGFTMTKRLKQDLRTSHIPVVLLTARADANSKLEGFGCGADAYLAKPFNRKELLVRIENLIHLRRQLQQRYITQAGRQYDLQAARDGGPGREDIFVNKVRQLLESHLYDEEFGITALCEALGMSRSQVYRKFAALTDTSVNQYLQNLRLEKARDLLKTTDLNVSEVAYDTGFKNPSHFSRVFSKRYGYAPSKARLRNPISG